MNHDVLDPQFILDKGIVLLPQNVFDLHHERVMDGVRGRARGKKARECCGESGRWSEGGGGGGGGGCSLSFVVGGGGGGISGVARGEISGLNGDGAEQWAASKHYRQMVPIYITQVPLPRRALQQGPLCVSVSRSLSHPRPILYRLGSWLGKACSSHPHQRPHCFRD